MIPSISEFSREIRLEFSLEAVELAYECPLRWEKLRRVARGRHANRDGDTVRFCAACESQVHNLSGMPREAAKRLVESSGASICVRVEVDAKGRSIHRPAVAALALALAACVPGADSVDSLDVGASGGDGTGAAAIRSGHGIAEMYSSEANRPVPGVHSRTVPQVDNALKSTQSDLPPPDRQMMGRPVMGVLPASDRSLLGRPPGPPPSSDSLE